MGLTDLIWAVAIVAGASYLLYRSLWKKKGHCSGSGCDGCGCSKHH